MKKIVFLSLLFTAPLMAEVSHSSKIQITHIEPGCSLFKAASDDSLKDEINAKGSSLSVITHNYKPRYARDAGLNKMVRIDLSLGEFMGGIPLVYDSNLGKYQYDKSGLGAVNKDMEFTQPWGSHSEYSLDLIHNTISLSRIDFDEEKKEARIGVCKLHFIEQTPQDAYYLKKVAIYHRLHSKE